MSKIRICFVCLSCYSLFNRSTRYYFGGSEVRAWMFGNGLSKCSDYEVSFIVLDHQQPRVEQYGNVKVYRHSHYKRHPTPSLFDRLQAEVSTAVRRSRRFPFIVIEKKNPAVFLKLPVVLLYRLWKNLSKTFRQLWFPSLWVGDYEISPDNFRVYNNANADVYCTFGVSNFTAEVAAYCRAYKKHFVLFAGSGDDFSEKYYKGSRERNSYGSVGHLCYHGIMQADLIITQTKVQAQSLLQRFGRSSVTIANPVDLLNTVARTPRSKRTVLWIGKSNEVKRPKILLQLAAIFRDIHFIMVCNRANSQMFEQVLQGKTENVKVLEYVPYGEIEKLFADAFVLINTSVFEGFPNTFLQAGKYGVPILSLNIDPDGFIERNECGIVAKGDVEKLMEGLSVIRSDKNKAQLFSENIQEYVSTYHSLDDKVNQLQKILREFISDGNPHSK